MQPVKNRQNFKRSALSSSDSSSDRKSKSKTLFLYGKIASYVAELPHLKMTELPWMLSPHAMTISLSSGQ